MKRVFEMIDLGILSSYLGIEVEQDNSCIWLTQTLYVENILSIFKINDCNSIKTPIEIQLKLMKDGKG